MKFGCHLGNEEDLIVLLKDIQGQSLSLVIPNQKGGRKLETLILRVVARPLRKLEDFRTHASLQTSNTINRINKTSKIINRIRI